VEIFDTLGVKSVYVARTPGTVRVETRHGPLQVVALPWIIRSNLLSRDDYKNMTIDKLDSVVSEKITTIMAARVADLDPTIPAILCAHGTVEGSTYGSERSVMLGQDIVFPKSIINNPAFAYVALGHIHKHQEINSAPPAVYAGSLERIDFGEEHDAKGFVIVDIDEHMHAAWRFVPINARRFLTIAADAGYDDPTDAALRAISRHNVKDAVVKLIVHAHTNVTLREDEIRRALADAYFIAAIVCETEHTVRNRLGDLAVEQMSPLDALAAYLKAHNIPEKRAQALLEHARDMLAQ
jgi:DNA repair protein SbcD/Mre11